MFLISFAFQCYMKPFKNNHDFTKQTVHSRDRSVSTATTQVQKQRLYRYDTGTDTAPVRVRHRY